MHCHGKYLLELENEDDMQKGKLAALDARMQQMETEMKASKAREEQLKAQNEQLQARDEQLKAENDALRTAMKAGDDQLKRDLNNGRNLV